MIYFCCGLLSNTFFGHMTKFHWVHKELQVCLYNASSYHLMPLITLKVFVWLIYPHKPSLATKSHLCRKQQLSVLEIFFYNFYALCGHFCPLRTISLYSASLLCFFVGFLCFRMFRDLSYILTQAIFSHSSKDSQSFSC